MPLPSSLDQELATNSLVAKCDHNMLLEKKLYWHAAMLVHLYTVYGFFMLQLQR